MKNKLLNKTFFKLYYNNLKLRSFNNIYTVFKSVKLFKKSFIIILSYEYPFLTVLNLMHSYVVVLISFFTKIMCNGRIMTFFFF